MEICLNINNIASIKNVLLLRIRLTLFLIGDDNLINIAVLEEKEENAFKLALLSIMKQLGFEDINISSKLESDLYEYVILNSDFFIMGKEIECNHFFINMDKVLENSSLIKGNLITYGYGNKNTVTISSFEGENSCFVYCIQRFMNFNFLRVLGPQEIPILTYINSEDCIYPYMVAITIGLLEGISPEQVKIKLDSKNLIYSV